MFDENNFVEVKWNPSNKDWFISKGYTYTGHNSVLNVKIKDLKPGSSKKISVTCDYCGKEFEAQYDIILKGRSVIQKDCCKSCGGKKGSEVSKIVNAQRKFHKLYDVCDKNGYTLLTDISEYASTKMQIRFICPKHGEQIMSFGNLTHGHACPKCARELVGNKLRKNMQDVICEIESVSGNKLLNPEDFKTVSKRNLKIQCSCGNVFKTSFANYTKHGVTTCYSCSCKESVPEKTIREYLEKSNIEFEQEKRFYDCRDNKPLPFDFYIPSKNLIIEFDGQHHYYQTHDEYNFIMTKKHDLIKNEYCKNNNINLIRIPYWEGRNIEKIISSALYT